ncbi:TIR domain-containing protein [Bacteroidota bacterium]
MAKRKVFYSFHFDNDCRRTQLVRNIGVIEGNKPVSANEWEEVNRKDAVKKWIDDNLKNKSCTIVLIGTETSERPLVKYEIERSWELGKAVFGIYIHNLKDTDGTQCKKGKNPFDKIYKNKFISDSSLSSHTDIYDPPYSDSKKVYNYIAENIESWIERAIERREMQKPWEI